ncbi:putative zinc finger protein CONSTANS-LIKE 11 [Platanthera zijinensis]|uniref:Zinc finger protein CONSTANS-LIKE 11 n=1 Tax=Platanthera zijinensis TaxID=2320716 RepID=A0AAP0GE59_9ASPA
MKGCDLCDRAASIFCESDQANLCWECDAQVHGANFLVARHTRVLLCRRCQAQTPWKASGQMLSPIFSSCEICVAISTAAPDSVEEANRIMDDFNDTEDDDESDAVEEAAEEEGDYQVVPATLTPPLPACLLNRKERRPVISDPR